MEKGRDSTENQLIRPIFLLAADLSKMGSELIQFTKDDYNKALGASLIDAKTDVEAIHSFLNEYRDSPETLRSYAKEVERLVLWCIHEGNINISSLKRDHLLQYQIFLKKPHPKQLWCGSKVAKLKKDGTLNDKWRPFVRELGGTTMKKSLKILDSFFNYLVQTNYLIGNPLAIDRRRKRRNQGKPRIVDRYLELDEIHAVLNTLDEQLQEEGSDKFQVNRAKYIILLLFYTGLRIEEAAKHRMGNFTEREGHWYLRVKGKGNKVRDIPVPDELLEALARFRLDIGLESSQPKFREKTPLIPTKSLKESISARRIDQILRWAFKLGACKLDKDAPRKASKLRSASAHWLRHSYVTYLLKAGASLKVVQKNAGHSDIGTTMLYSHVAQADCHEETRHLSLT